MEIPGNNNRNNAKRMTAQERGAQVVHGDRGSRKIPDSHNRPRTIGAAIVGAPGPPRAVKPVIPDGHNSRLAVP